MASNFNLEGRMRDPKNARAAAMDFIDAIIEYEYIKNDREVTEEEEAKMRADVDSDVLVDKWHYLDTIRRIIHRVYPRCSQAFSMEYRQKVAQFAKDADCEITDGIPGTKWLGELPRLNVNVEGVERS